MFYLDQVHHLFSFFRLLECQNFVNSAEASSLNEVTQPADQSEWRMVLIIWREPGYFPKPFLMMELEMLASTDKIW